MSTKYTRNCKDETDGVCLKELDHWMACPVRGCERTDAYCPAHGGVQRSMAAMAEHIRSHETKRTP